MRRQLLGRLLVGTVGRLAVPGGSINVIPGRCEFSIDVRSLEDGARDAADADIDAEIARIAARRGVTATRRRILEAASVSCDESLQDALAASVERITSSTAMRLPSGAGCPYRIPHGPARARRRWLACG